MSGLERTLSQLIRMRTVTADRAANRRALEWVAARLAGLPLHAKHFNIAGRHSLVLTTTRTKRPKLLLQAHMDVVPAEAASFRPVVRRGRLYGRGALDMKFAIASYLVLLREIGTGLRDYDLGLMLTTDEEEGGTHGAQALVGRGYGGMVCIVPDGGENWQLERSAKGVLHVEITSNGAGGHASQTWGTTNAIDVLIRYLAELKSHFADPATAKDAARYNTMNIGRVHGGEVINAVARKAKAEVDLRFTPGVTPSELLALLRRVAKPYRTIRIKPIITADALQVDPAKPAVRAFTDIAKRHLGKRLPPVDSHGSSDARFFSKRGPVIITRPTGGGNHAPTEWISLRELERFHAILSEYVRTYGQA